jgi:glycosyltransferase involved in cell wall biosynthesis
MEKLTSISAVFPAYNDGGTIPSMVLTALLTMRRYSDDVEVVVVNDGSRDYTGEVLAELARRCPELRVITHPQNQGYGATLRDGFHHATKEWVFYTDGDAQYNPCELSKLIDALEPGIDVVNGYKIARGDSWVRLVIGRVYYTFVRMAFGFKLRDVNCDFRLIRRALFDAVELESDSGTICLELVKTFQDHGYRFAEVPVHHYPRVYGRSQFLNLRRLVRTARQLYDLWWKLVVRKEHLKETQEPRTRLYPAG